VRHSSRLAIRSAEGFVERIDDFLFLDWGDGAEID
jgi:hypothetical protein